MSSTNDTPMDYNNAQGLPEVNSGEFNFAEPPMPPAPEEPRPSIHAATWATVLARMNYLQERVEALTQQQDHAAQAVTPENITQAEYNQGMGQAASHITDLTAQLQSYHAKRNGIAKLPDPDVFKGEQDKVDLSMPGGL